MLGNYNKIPPGIAVHATTRVGVGVGDGG